MKTTLLSLSLLICGQVFASNGPILTKATYPGYTMLESAISTRCEVYTDKIVKTTDVGGMVAGKVESSFTFDRTTDYQHLAFLAVNAEITVLDTRMADGASSQYSALFDNNGQIEFALLKETGRYIKENKSQAAAVLINFLDVVCK